MDDLVKRSDAIHAIHERIKQIGKDKDPYVLSIRQSVREIPAVDAVEVVRCRECRNGLYSEYYGNVVCSAHHWTRGPKYYCGDGKCREDGDSDV